MLVYLIECAALVRKKKNDEMLWWLNHEDDSDGHEEMELMKIRIWIIWVFKESGQLLFRTDNKKIL